MKKITVYEINYSLNYKGSYIAIVEANSIQEAMQQLSRKINKKYCGQVFLQYMGWKAL